MTRAIAIAFGCAALCAEPVAQFTSRVELVRIDTLVTAGGKPVRGLSAADFEVRDNGILQRIRLEDAGVSQLDVILALDLSASLTSERLAQLRRACEALLTQLRREDRAALVTFNHRVTRHGPLTADFEGIRSAIRDVGPSGRTSLVDAIFAGISLAEGGDRRTLLIVFSDGMDTSSWLEPASVADVASRSSVVVYGVSTTPVSSTPGTLRTVSEATGGDVLDGRSSRLESAFTDVLNEFRQRYLLTFSPERTSTPGWHRLDVRVKRRGVTVRARSGYFVAPKS